MYTPRLSEAVAAFPRGMKVELDNVTMLFISGTASVGDQGQSCHVGDFTAQAERADKTWGKYKEYTLSPLVSQWQSKFKHMRDEAVARVNT